MNYLKSAIIAGAALLMLAPASSNAADVLVDDFTSPSLTTEVRPWGGTSNWRNILNGIGGGNDNWKGGTLGGTNKLRSIADTSPGNNDTYSAAVVAGSIRYNHGTSTDGGGITNSGATSANRAFQQLANVSSGALTRELHLIHGFLHGQTADLLSQKVQLLRAVLVHAKDSARLVRSLFWRIFGFTHDYLRRAFLSAPCP